LSVPADTPPSVSNASERCVAVVEVCGQAVGGDHVEPDAGEERHARGGGVGAAPADPLEDRQLAGDVQVVGPGVDAGVDHRVGGLGEGAGAVEHRVDVAEVIAGVGDRKRPGPEVVCGGDPAGLRGVAAGDDRVVPTVDRRLDHEAAGVAVRAVDEESRGVGVGHTPRFARD
jgi:hypothetical protein